MDYVIFILGATATGKTNLAIELTKYLSCELISVDSALVYKGMDIGTGKPSFKHHLIDILEPNQNYSAASFRADSLELIKQILAKGKIPILVGGTFLYFKALLNNLADLPNANEQIRYELNQQLQLKGLNFLHHKLEQIDPISALKIHAHDKQRIMRALEVFYLTGKPLSLHLAEQFCYKFPYKVIQFGLNIERSELHKRIAVRFKQMLELGFVDEVVKLYNRGDLNDDMPAIRAVGYRQIWQYLAARCSYAEACEKAIIATRQLAKRQCTWLSSWDNVINLNGKVSSSENAIKIIKYLESFN